ncbi:MAG: NAD(P)H-dependent flavin oxidoreductase [Bacteroidota bacterium]
MNSFNIGDLFIPVPVVQGGMGIGISLSGLASAVANMGGIGVISTVGIGLIDDSVKSGYRQMNIDAIRKEVRKAREKTKGVLGVNIMSVITNFSDMVKTSIEEGIDVIFSGAGLPLDLPKYLSEGVKTKLVPIVSSARAASLLYKKWKQNFNYVPDAFVVEGPKAGGHLGYKPNALDEESNRLETIVTEVLEVTKEIEKEHNRKIPVIAAGGIFSGQDVHDILTLGASAVQMGTRFVATTECDAAIEFKHAFVNASDADIKIIKSPVGMPGRTIFNQFLLEAYEGKRRPKVCRHNCIKSCDPKTTAYCISEALLAAYQGRLSDGFAFTGVNGSRIREISTVEQVFNELEQEYQTANKTNDSLCHEAA